MSLQTDIQKIYVAYFNRPADVAGLQYWTKAVESGGATLSSLTQSFAASSEYLKLYAASDAQGLVSTVYKNLFGRSPEAEGLNYWTKELQEGRASIGDIAYRALNGAVGTDLQTINNKAAAAGQFTKTLAGAGSDLAYTPEVQGKARVWLSGIDHTPTSLLSAEGSVGALIGTADPIGPGRIFSFEVGVGPGQGWGSNTGAWGEHVIQDFVIGRDKLQITDPSGNKISISTPTYYLDMGNVDFMLSAEEARKNGTLEAHASVKTLKQWDYAPLMAGETALISYNWGGTRYTHLFVDDGDPAGGGVGGNGAGTAYLHWNNDLFVDLTGLSGLRIGADGVTVAGSLFV